MADKDRYWVLKFAFSLSHCVFVPPDVRSWDGGFRRRFPCDKKRDTNPFVFRVRLDVFRCACRRDPIDFATQVVSSFITQQITPDVPLDTALWNLRLKRTQAHRHTYTHIHTHSDKCQRIPTRTNHSNNHSNINKNNKKSPIERSSSDTTTQ